MKKRCTKCEEVKETKLFCKNKRNLDGLDSWCKECHKTNSKKYKKQNKDKITEYNKKYYENNKEQHKINSLKWKRNNVEKSRQFSKNHYTNNKDYYINKRKQRKLKEKLFTPKWLSKDQKDQINEYYKKAQQLTQDTSIEHQVDHIIPITNDTVCGLHVPWNLQILTKQENLRKYNKFDGTINNDSWKTDNEEPTCQDEQKNY